MPDPVIPKTITILVDCGIARGHDPQVPFDQFPVPPADIDFLFLTHAGTARRDPAGAWGIGRAKSTQI